MSISSLVYSQKLVELDNYLKEVHSQHVIPGFSVVVVNDKGPIYQKGFGKQQLGLSQPFTTRTVSAIGSLTKSITAMAIMQLVEEGRLELDTPVVKYLPWFRTANKAESDKVTVRMLINNTSGLKADPYPAYDLSDNALEKMTRDLKSTFITKEPGTSYEYSNLSFGVAGYLIANVSGMSYMEYLDKRIFGPLAMHNTSTDPARFSSLGALEGHFLGITSASPAMREKPFESGEYIPAGSFTRSSAQDLGNYLTALLNGGTFGNTQVLTKESVHAMWTPNSSFPGISPEEGGDGKPIHYGLGWMISEIEGRHIIHHGGSTGKMSSMTMIDLTNNIAVSLLSNIDLTFIDQYQYPTIFTLTNNILHIAMGASETEFGRPIVADPTINDFNMDIKHMENYIGEFLQIRGGDFWMNFDLSMDIKEKDENGLKAIITRGENTVNQFLLDFASPTLAISRNMARPQKLRFVVAPGGEVKGLFCGGVKYIKVNKEAITKYKKIQFKDVGSFLLPKHWDFKELVDGFVGTDPEDSSIQIRGYLKTHDKDDRNPSDIFSAHSGPWFDQRVGEYVWQHRSRVVSSDNEKEIHTTFISKMDNVPLYFVVVSEGENHTGVLRELMMTFLKSLSI